MQNLFYNNYINKIIKTIQEILIIIKNYISLNKYINLKSNKLQLYFKFINYYI